MNLHKRPVLLPHAVEPFSRFALFVRYAGRFLPYYRRTSPGRASKCRRTIHRFDWAYRVTSCAVIIGQAAETRHGVTELPLDHRVFDLGSHLGRLDPANGLVQGTALAQLLVDAAAGDDLPDDLTALVLGTLFDTDIAGIGAEHVFLAMQQWSNWVCSDVD